MRAVCVEIARVATNLNRLVHAEKLQPPFVLRTAFTYVINMLKFLQMFVRFAVKLEISLQVRFVATKFADVVPNDHHQHVRFRFASVSRKMAVESVEAVG